MSTINKALSTERILKFGVQHHCTKLSLDNIVFPKWNDTGLFGMMIAQVVKTKEAPLGCNYDEAIFQLVLRILDGKLLVSNRPDCYCWEIEAVQKQYSKGNVRPIGTASARGLINLSNCLQTIVNEDEKTLFADFFTSLNKDLMLIRSAAEERICIPVTQELYDSGIRECVDSWIVPDANGMAPSTSIFPGDILIVNKKSDGTYVYRVGAEEASMTYRIGEPI